MITIKYLGNVYEVSTIVTLTEPLATQYVTQYIVTFKKGETNLYAILSARELLETVKIGEKKEFFL